MCASSRWNSVSRMRPEEEVLKPIRKGLPGILIELKAGKNCSDEELKNMSEAALKHITDKKYDTEMKNAGIQTIYKYGVAFSGKNVDVAVE